MRIKADCPNCGQKYLQWVFKGTHQLECTLCGYTANMSMRIRPKEGVGMDGYRDMRCVHCNTQWVALCYKETPELECPGCNKMTPVGGVVDNRNKPVKCGQCERLLKFCECLDEDGNPIIKRSNDDNSKE